MMRRPQRAESTTHAQQQLLLKTILYIAPIVSLWAARKYA